MDHSQLIEQAVLARQAAYAPYSQFRVGAALLCRDGRIFLGSNVENAVYGLGICAERVALFSAIAAGCQRGEFSALAVVGDAAEPISPCGACRQVLLELGGGELPVIRANLHGAQRLSLAGELLPDSFVASDLPG